ncbi:MAG: FmdB family zinc ribbon protein, partial [Candidatus Saccharicenans sp.]
YRCKKCHHQFEILQKMTDQSLKSCPVCGGPLVRIISSPSIQFKGSGWYITDYAHKNSPAGGNGHNGQKAGPRKSEKSEQKAKAKEENQANHK